MGSKCTGTAHYSKDCYGPSDVKCCISSYDGSSGDPACSYPSPCSMKKASSYTFKSHEALKAFEGEELDCYLDPKKKDKVWTVGYGHACQDESDQLPKYGVTCNAAGCVGSVTSAEALQILKDDFKTFEAAVRDLVFVDITQNQYDALVIFAFNIGKGGFKMSEVLWKLNFGMLSDKEAQVAFTNWHGDFMNLCCSAHVTRRRMVYLLAI